MSDTSVTTTFANTDDETNTSTEVALVEADNAIDSAIAAIASGNALAYSSLTGTDWDTKLAQLQAVTNSKPLRDHLNQQINVRNIIIQSVMIDVTSPASGEITPTRQPRIILLDDDNNAFHAISNGLFKSVGNIIGILGQPNTWQGSVGIKVKSEQGKAGRYMTAEMVNVHKLTPKK